MLLYLNIFVPTNLCKHSAWWNLDIVTRQWILGIIVTQCSILLHNQNNGQLLRFSFIPRAVLRIRDQNADYHLALKGKWSMFQMISQYTEQNKHRIYTKDWNSLFFEALFDCTKQLPSSQRNQLSAVTANLISIKTKLGLGFWLPVFDATTVKWPRKIKFPTRARQALSNILVVLKYAEGCHLAAYQFWAHLASTAKPTLRKFCP